MAGFEHDQPRDPFTVYHAAGTARHPAASAGAGASLSPMSRNVRKIELPYSFEKLGRVAKIKF